MTQIVTDAHRLVILRAQTY